MTKNQSITIVAMATMTLLLVPLVAMGFTDEIDWKLFDFIVAGALLFGTGLAFVLLARKGNNRAYQAGVGVALAAALFIVWANLAVGIIGNENNSVNLIFFGVVGIAILGACLVRFRPLGMSQVVMVTALAQLAGGLVALYLGDVRSFVFNGVIVALWATSAWLFRRAASAP